jgi:Tfp pilus assembly protein PilF
MGEEIRPQADVLVSRAGLSIRIQLALAVVASIAIGVSWWWLMPDASQTEVDKTLAENRAPRTGESGATASSTFPSAATSAPAAAGKIAPGAQALDGTGVTNFPATPKLEAIRQSVHEDPSDPVRWQELGYDYAILGRADLALDALAQARAHDDGTNGLHSRLGWAYFNLGHADEALREWQRANEISGGGRYYDAYCLSLGNWANGDPTEAVRYYQAAVEKDPSFGDVEAFQKRIEKFTTRERRMFSEIFDAWRKSYAPQEPTAAPAPASIEATVQTPAPDANPN